MDTKEYSSYEYISVAATDKKQWADYLSGKISEGAFKNNLKSQEV